MNDQSEDAHGQANTQDNSLPGKPAYLLRGVKRQGDAEDAQVGDQHHKERIANNHPCLTIHPISKNPFKTSLFFA
jgi:hypothetical protein